MARRRGPVLVASRLAAAYGGMPEGPCGDCRPCPVPTAQPDAARKALRFDARSVDRVSGPFPDTARERYSMYLLERYGLPRICRSPMLHGFA